MSSRIQVDSSIHFGKPCVAGTRVTVQSVLELINEGITFEEIRNDYYPDISIDDIKACMDSACLSDHLGREKHGVTVMDTFYKLPLVLDPQPEGGWTITCPILPDLITEADTWDEIEPNVSEALQSVVEIYEHLKKPMPSVLNPINGLAPFLTDTIIHLENA